MSKKQTIMALTIEDPDNILQITHDGLRVVIYFKPDQVPIGQIGKLTVKTVESWEKFKDERVVDEARLRVQQNGKLVLQEVRGDSMPPVRDRGGGVRLKLTIMIIHLSKKCYRKHPILDLSSINA